MNIHDSNGKENIDTGIYHEKFKSSKSKITITNLNKISVKNTIKNNKKTDCLISENVVNTKNSLNSNVNLRKRIAPTDDLEEVGLDISHGKI